MMMMMLFFYDKKKIQIIIKAIKDLIPKNFFVFNCLSFLFDTTDICIQTTCHHPQEANLLEITTFPPIYLAIKRRIDDENYF